LHTVGGVVVAVSKPKLKSWGVEGKVIEPPVDPDEYGDYTGELPEGIRVANFVSKRSSILAWNVHREIVRNIPLLLVGNNPDISGVEPARDWDHLRHLLRTHRFYLHTSDPNLEDGYNLALLEAMGTGLPVVATCSPTSPVVDGHSGFISDDVGYLRWGIQQLLNDPQLAFQMGERGRQLVLERFSVSRFLESWHEAIGEARARQQSMRRESKKFANYRGSWKTPEIHQSRCPN
jgi:glycosyltransferase involved in cell wall biosynthesis